MTNHYNAYENQDLRSNMDNMATGMSKRINMSTKSAPLTTGPAVQKMFQFSLLFSQCG